LWRPLGNFPVPLPLKSGFTIWDHTVLPATRQTWLSPFTSAEAVILDLATPKGCKAELTWVSVTSQDRLPARDSHPPQKITGNAVTGIRTHDRESKVRHHNHYTTKPPNRGSTIRSWSGHGILGYLQNSSSQFDSSDKIGLYV